MMIANLAKPVQPISYETIRELMAPAAWPMNTEEVEARRHTAERLLGRPFPKLSREALGKQKIHDLTAVLEWGLLDTLRRGNAPHVAKL